MPVVRRRARLTPIGGDVYSPPTSGDASKTLGLSMRYLGSQLFVGVVIAGATLGGLAPRAHAQMAPGGMGPMGGAQQPAGDTKKEGVAEEAPKAPGLLPTTPALPPPRGHAKRWKLLEMGGYFRVRTDWFKNFNLGFIDDPAQGGAPFPRDLDCNASQLDHPCDDVLSSTNMRLRLEPVLHLSEGTSVHVQADVFDNLVFGSTPDGTNYSGVPFDAFHPPLGAFTGTQSPPVRGVNSDRSSIVVKRAWAEVAVPLGILKAGRMPNHWGLGIWANAGGYDPIHGTYDYDADYGDSVDRVSFSAMIPGTPLRAMVAHDWDLTALTSNQTSADNGHEGHPFALDTASDRSSWVGVISKMETPQEFKDATERGDRVLDYGVYFEYKTQSWAYNQPDFQIGDTPDPSQFYFPRGLKTYTGDLWGRAGLGSVVLEAELVGQLGSVSHLDDLGVIGSADIRKFGGVGRATWTGVDGKLRLGLEGGFATGDQWDNTPQGATNIVNANLLGDPTICNAQHSCTLSQFIFNPAYHVDMILWRRLVGAVTNAAYAKPFLEYDLTKSIMVKVANVTSFALKPVATPGNSDVYGTEFDADVGYAGHNVFAGISYGVLFPFGAMAHPQGDATDPSFGYSADNTNDPATAQTIQARLVLSF
jgi:uncharacterized protein (TIGR04551 family)